MFRISQLKSFVIVVLWSINVFCSVAQTGNPINFAIKQEVDRNLNSLKMEGFPSPFFISYAISDLHHLKVEASFGAVTQSFETHERTGLPFVLVGNFQRNNLKYVYEFPGLPQKVSLDNDPTAIGFAIWTDLDKEYKRAVRAYESKKGLLSQTTLMPEEQALPDYEQTPAVNLMLPPAEINMNRNYWENYARAASALVNKYPEIINSNVKVELKNRMNYYYDTEGCQFAVPDVYCDITFNAYVMTENGEELWSGLHYYHSSTDKIPGLEIFLNDCEKKITHLLRLKNAPLAEKPYSGPVLYEKTSLIWVFILNLLNNQLSATGKLLNGSGGNSLEMMTGEKIISNQLTVKSLSGTKIYKGQILDGYFPIDSEGVVPPEELTLIENGVLKNMLSNRIPTVKNPHSNGHYRFDFLTSTMRRYIEHGVLQITGNNAFPDADMKQELINAARRTGLEYAYIIGDSITRVYVADGREELVRGIESNSHFLKINLFKRILGVSDEVFIYSRQNLGVVK